MTTPRVCLQCGARHYAKDLCQRCYQAKQRQEHPERARANARKSWEAHQEETRARSRTWYQHHRTKKIAYSMAYKATHREAVNARQRARYHAGKQEPPPPGE